MKKIVALLAATLTLSQGAFAETRNGCEGINPAISARNHKVLSAACSDRFYTHMVVSATSGAIAKNYGAVGSLRIFFAEGLSSSKRPAAAVTPDFSRRSNAAVARFLTLYDVYLSKHVWTELSYAIGQYTDDRVYNPPTHPSQASPKWLEKVEQARVLAAVRVSTIYAKCLKAMSASADREFCAAHPAKSEERK